MMSNDDWGLWFLRQVAGEGVSFIPSPTLMAKKEKPVPTEKPVEKREIRIERKIPVAPPEPDRPPVDPLLLLLLAAAATVMLGWLIS